MIDMHSITISNEDAKPIWYISDLHFDYAKNLTIYKDRINNFFDIVTAHPNVIFVLAGDFFNDYEETTAFIEQLEKNHVTCILVLGNHDYWSNGKYTYAQILKKMEKATAKNRFAHLLTTGRIVELNNQVFIGDSGFTNFQYRVKDNRDPETGELIKHPDVTATLTDFGNNFIELSQVRDWNIESIQTLHNRWIEFANQQISKIKNLIVVTHWPMFAQSPDNPQSTWWQSKTNLLKTNRFWSIYGHTHRNGLKSHDASVQIGYQSGNDFALLRFGQLVPLSSSRSLATIGNRVRQHQTLQLEEPEQALASSNRVSRSGYKRAAHADNKRLLVAFLTDREALFADIKEKAGPKVRPLNGLFDADAAFMNNAHDDVLDSLKILEAGYQDNAFDFYTALIIAGYAYSGNLRYLDQMRPVDIYDVAREYMELFTLQYFQKEIDIHEELKTRASTRKDSHLMVGNISLKFPRINGHEVPPIALNDFQSQISKMVSIARNTQTPPQIEAPQPLRVENQVHDKAGDFLAWYNQDDSPEEVAFNIRKVHIVNRPIELAIPQKNSVANMKQFWTKSPVSRPKVGMLIHHRSMGIGKITAITDAAKGQYLADFPNKKNVELYSANGLVSAKIPTEYNNGQNGLPIN